MKKYASYRERVEAPGPKRMLSLDGGGIRGLISIEILARIEHELREAYGDPHLVLADYFDYIAGTSTGAIIASGISLGMTMLEIREFYLRGARHMLKPAPFFRKLWYSLRVTGLTDELQRRLGDTRLGDPGLTDPSFSEARKAYPIRTLLLLVMYRCDTDSPWPLSNNPKAKYNVGTLKDGNNAYLPLWQLVRASTAAPTYFPPQEIVIGDQTCIFVDGAVTAYNNPAYALYMMATLEPYRLCWERGEKEMLLVSVGTGSIPNSDKRLKPRQMTLLYNARRVPSAVIYASTVEADKMCRVTGRCTFGGKIDSEIGDLVEPLPAPSVRPKEFTYVRYDPDLSEKGLTDLGVFPRITSEQVLPLISGEHVQELTEVGGEFARKSVNLAHFGSHAPAPVVS